MRLSDAIHVSELSQMDRLTLKKKHNRTWRVWNSSDKTSSCLLLGSKWASASLHSLTCSCVSTGGRGSASKSNAAPVTGASDYARRIDLLPQSVEQASTKTSRSCSRFQIEQELQASGFSDLAHDQHVGTGFSGAKHASAGTGKAGQS
jgi:hypothetical protein